MRKFKMRCQNFVLYNPSCGTSQILREVSLIHYFYLELIIHIYYRSNYAYIISHVIVVLSIQALFATLSKLRILFLNKLTIRRIPRNDVSDLLLGPIGG